MYVGRDTRSSLLTLVVILIVDIFRSIHADNMLVSTEELAEF